MTENLKQDDFLIVGIGASAGGLEACRRFIQGLPEPCGMAFVLVVHLDPTHESLMADLLASHTAMKVVQAVAGMRIEADHLYIIPPGAYISVAEGVLHLSKPEAPHGMRLPYDYWLKSQAKDFGARSVCVVLSGSGADGSQGLRAIKAAGGLVLVQDPAEAEYDGMPRNASETGLGDHVLKLETLRKALMSHAEKWIGRAVSPETEPTDDLATEGPLQSIIDLLHERTQRDFRLYKRGTLRRRVERRMSMSGIGPEGMADYRQKLNDDAHEVEELSKDLLINVTRFFRDEKTFDYLSSRIIPDMIANHPTGRALRIWIAGCSTGEEAYSLCMAFAEAIAESKRHIKLQVFASDLDPDAVSVAREGVYADTLTTDISTERLKRFFTKDGNLYRVTPELRALVVFTVQDLLADPPFSRLDFVSCRNLLIYLSPEAQTRAMLLLHFALRKGGYMLLGSSETASHFESQFEVVSKVHRLYQCIGRASAVDVKLPLIIEDGGRVNVALATTPLPSKQAALADLCRRWVIEAYAPAVVLINSRHECLYMMGPIERFLSMPQGYPTLDLLAMAPSGLRSRLRTALARIGSKPLQTADPEDASVSDTSIPNIDIRSIHHEGEVYFLIGFHEGADQALAKSTGDEATEVGVIDPLRAELKSVRRELTEALQNLESLSEDHRAINEEALSINEEYQSTNEELLTSKEELQSLNEELTALNGQLQETLELKRTAANDLQNVLYSTDVATLFLDTQLNIRLFTPATTALFRIIPSDVGRPLTDLKSLSPDENLSGDAREVLQNLLALEREVETPSGQWFIRRIMPYRMDAKAVAGVVITYTDITERKAISRALEGAKLQSEQANLAKSRFLAAVSHDLRQPLQSLALLQGLLAKMAEGEGAEKLVKRLEGTLETMAGMLNTLLDINQFETGQIQPNKSRFALNDLLDNLKAEFATQAESLGLDLRILPSSLYVYTDQILLEQMLRNLLSNALKYTRKGRVLVGVRHVNDHIRLEVYDTGIGIPRTQLDLIFEEHHQIDNAARQRSQGLGLGLSIVQRLGRILHHRVQVRSTMGRGSVFSVEIERALEVGKTNSQEVSASDDFEVIVVEPPLQARAAILVIEDDPEVRELLCLLLENEGHEVVAVGDGLEAVEAIAKGMIKPRLVLADYNLPHGLNGTAVADRLREMIRADLPVIVLTGDISTTTERDIANHNCVRLNKPVKLDELLKTIDQLMLIDESAIVTAMAVTEVPLGAALIYVIDDDARIREDMRDALQAEGYRVEAFADGESFLATFRPGIEACMLIDAYLPGMDGLAILQAMRGAGHDLPAIMITGLSDITTAVSAMKAGASDFLQKPISTSELLKCLHQALELSRDSDQVKALQEDAIHQLSSLTKRQHQIMTMVLAGQPSKNIAVDLNISQRTVENHRATIMAKAGVKSLPALARMAVAAFGVATDDSKV